MTATEEFLFRTSGLFEEAADSVVCGPLVRTYYKDDYGVLKNINVRKVEFFSRDGEYFETQGVWVQDSILEPLEEDDDLIGYEVGKHKKTITISVESMEFVLAEYTDRLQVVVRDTLPGHHLEVIMSKYVKKVHYGTVKYLMESVNSRDEVENFIEKIQELE